MNRIFLPLLLILFLMPGCITVNTGVSPNQGPAAYIDRITPSNPAPGEQVSFTGHGTDPNGSIVGYEWRSSIDGKLSTIAEFTTAALSGGTHTIYFKVMDNAGTWSPEVTSTVIVAAGLSKPVIESFAVSDPNINQGAPVELNWKVSGAKTVQIDNGIGPVQASGSRSLFPLADTTYTITATNDEGSTTAKTSVKVQQVLTSINPDITFTCEWISGTSWRLNWSVQNATDIKMEPDIGPISMTGSKVVNVPSGPPKTYKITATNSNTGGWATHEVTMKSP